MIKKLTTDEELDQNELFGILDDYDSDAFFFIEHEDKFVIVAAL
jgi:hypothetical protein